MQGMTSKRSFRLGMRDYDVMEILALPIYGTPVLNYPRETGPPSAPRGELGILSWYS